MRPLSDCDDERLASLSGVLADIDDTLTTGGRLGAAAYAALEALHDIGLVVIPVTGRPAGWCDHIARMWPVTAVVGENGAFWFRYDYAARRMRRHFVAGASEREVQRERLRAIAAMVLKAVPRARISADQHYREADLAIDYCEDGEALATHDVERIVAVMREQGLNAKVSSIHVNGWFGDHDKLSTTIDLLTRELGHDASTLDRDFAFVGDSPNDQPMFAYFECAIGVANVRDFADRLATLPAYVTAAKSGAGFAEFASRVCRARNARYGVK